MKDFSGKLAVITGGGTGMGRELARQLIAEGCDVAICDVIEDNMLETRRICEAEAPQGRVISAFHCDVADEDNVLAWRDFVKQTHQRGYVNLLFNNAGIGGGGSFINDTRENWDRTFNICWYGVYYTSRAFLPLLLAADEAHLINTSSVNGFWASLGPKSSHTAYSAAKFAVKGFSEALINDFRNHAPHVKVSVVMPGHIGTDIGINSQYILGRKRAADMTDEDLGIAREQMGMFGLPVDKMSLEDIRQAIAMQGVAFRENAPTTAAEAAKMMIDGVREERWRILLGDDAKRLDQAVRKDPENAYEESFMAEAWGRDSALGD
ncbi:MAG: SDR family NAD(P)-dependent oxidoreductase [Proteobacteria bacterium]|nr:SDR family NAD(P)-dependent oxidoreductase [Pseudomonadota bacterium]